MWKWMYRYTNCWSRHTSWRWVVSFTPLPLYPRYPLDRRLGGPQSRSGRCGEEKILDHTGTLGRPARSQSLYRLRYPSSFQKTTLWINSECYLLGYDAAYSDERNAVMWDVSSQRWRGRLRFPRMWCAVVPLFYPKDGRIWFLRNVGMYSPSYTTSFSMAVILCSSYPYNEESEFGSRCFHRNVSKHQIHSAIIDSTALFWAIAFLKRFYETASGFHFFRFRNSNSFAEQDRQPCVQRPTWRSISLYLCPPVTGWPSYTHSN
jgi:hypothetical protein